MKDLFLIKNRQAANVYMDKVSQERVSLLLKIHRCYGLSEYEKLILYDLIEIPLVIPQ
jgi:hypothetical protein